MDITQAGIKKMLDVALLQPTATPAQIEALAHVVRDEGFGQICVNTWHTARAAAIVKGSPAKVVACVSFPMGATKTSLKVCETEQALLDGADEIDMVINVGALKAGDDALVQRDIAAVVAAAHRRGAACKVIIEAALLTDEEKVRACQFAKAAGADYVKTSTGFGPGGATAEDVALMRRTVGPEMGVKAAGGIRTLAQAKAMIAAGATRIGASAGVKIIQGAEAAPAPAAPAAASKAY